MAIELRELLIADYDVVEIVHDGAALIEATQRALPDAIVCDIAMPRITGLAAAASILTTQPEARIVFVTVQDSRAVLRKALDLGVRGYVLKSDAGKELVAAVRSVIEGGVYLSANARRALGMTGRPSATNGEES